MGLADPVEVVIPVKLVEPVDTVDIVIPVEHVEPVDTVEVVGPIKLVDLFMTYSVGSVDSVTAVKSMPTLVVGVIVSNISLRGTLQ